MKNLNTLTLTSSETFEIVGVPVILARTSKNRWYLADSMTGNLLTAGFTSEKLALERMEKLENRRVKGNLVGFRFGSKIDTNTVEAYAAQVWQGLFELTGTIFDGHYWWTQVESTETGKVSELVRADYVINYLRIPEGLETEATINRAVQLGARWED